MTKTYEEITVEQANLNKQGLLPDGVGIHYDAIRYIDTAEVAKLIRRVLKDEFAGFKFSVRVSRYAGGSSIDLTYPKEFTTEQVRRLNEITRGFASARFDGMTDSSSHAYSWLLPSGRAQPAYCAAFGTHPEEKHANPGKAELVNMGASYVSSQRDW